VIEQNFFIEKMMPIATVRKLSDTEMNHYRKPYLDKKSRLPMLVWPNEIPIDGTPEDVHSYISNSRKWLAQSEIPKLLLWAKPGMILSEESVHTMKKEIRNLETVFVGKGKHYLQEDQPTKIGSEISNWLEKIQ